MQRVYQSAPNNDSKRTFTNHIIVKFQNARNGDLTAFREKKMGGYKGEKSEWHGAP